ncbi:MAG TPA: GapR family DNA-binding domain-containing protein [Rhizomicrobium sp.]|nr:GapR family DNA-binding domain-containing protein [Rhizomicrobium sp.]
MRKVVALRKLDTAERQEQDAVLDLYLSALGMRD